MLFLCDKYSRIPAKASKPFIVLLIIATTCVGCADTRPRVDTRTRVDTRPRTQVTTQQDQTPAQRQIGRRQYTPRQPSVKPAPTGVNGPDLLMPSLTLVNERIFAYEQKIDLWQKLSTERSAFTLDQTETEKMLRCRRELGGMLTAYNRLHEQLLRGNSMQTQGSNISATLFELQKQDIAFLESDCNQPMTAAVAGVAPAAAMQTADIFKQAEESINRAATDGLYDNVIKIYEALPQEKNEHLSRKTIFQYGFAMMKSGHQQEAVNTFKQLLANPPTVERVQWEFKVLQLLSDLNFGMGRFEEAKAGYNELSQAHQTLTKEKDWAVFHASTLNEAGAGNKVIRDYAALILQHLSYAPERDGFKLVRSASQFLVAHPSSPLAPIAEAILAEAREPAQKWFDTKLMELSQLINEQKYSEALQLIQAIPPGNLQDEQQALLKTRSDEIISAQAIEIEQQRLREQQRLQTNWNKAMTSLEAKQYDQAIAIFSTMEDTPYKDKARERITEAANLAALDGRREAAELFVRATRANDIENKKELLFASHRLLSEILVKYPNSELTDKINRNLQRIRDEIAAINPLLLNDPALDYPEPASRATDAPGNEPAPDYGNANSRAGENLITQ